MVRSRCRSQHAVRFHFVHISRFSHARQKVAQSYCKKQHVVQPHSLPVPSDSPTHPNPNCKTVTKPLQKTAFRAPPPAFRAPCHSFDFYHLAPHLQLPPTHVRRAPRRAQRGSRRGQDGNVAQDSPKTGLRWVQTGPGWLKTGSRWLKTAPRRLDAGLTGSNSEDSKAEESGSL